MEILKGTGDVKYGGKGKYRFNYYNADEKIMGKPMREHLKFAMSYWHTICAEGADQFGEGVLDKNFGESEPMKIYRKKADFAFEVMNKLGIEYYCYHDVDIAPKGRDLRESVENLGEMADYLESLQKANGKKLLWATANNFGDKMFACGASTSPSPDVFAVAAAKVKATMDSAKKLGGEGYVFWGGREGYDTLLNTDMDRELRNMATFMKMAVKYKEKIGFKGCFYIEPKPKEPTKHQYDFDAATAIGFLRANGLDKDFKLNIEANHATLAGHTFQHELRVAAINGMLGSIDANSGDLLLGWDTDCFPTNVYDTTLCMYEVLKSGGFRSGGLNFDAKTRRASNTLEDILYAYIAGMDAFALGLIKAAEIIEDGRIDEFVKSRYSGYDSGIGKKISDGDTDFEELYDYAMKIKSPLPNSGRQDYLENVMNEILFGRK